MDLFLTEFVGEPQVTLETPIDVSLTEFEGEPQVGCKTPGSVPRWVWRDAPGGL